MADLWPLSGLKVETEATFAQKSIPLGMHSGRVDVKGRLKVPVEVEDYLKGERLFVTSFDGKVGRIYPLPLWLENAKLLFDDMEDPEGAEALSLMADKYGASATLDAEGRVLLPTILRRKMGIENKPVQLRYYQGAIHIMSMDLFEEMDRQAEEQAADKLKTFRRKGLK